MQHIPRFFTNIPQSRASCNAGGAICASLYSGVLEGGSAESMTEKKRIPAYKWIEEPGGLRYKFFCEASGALVCTTGVYRGTAPEEALWQAWDLEGRAHFNSCRNCRKLVSAAMFNVDVLECVECAPFEAEARFCKSCGTQIDDPYKTCPRCGKPLMYHGKELMG